MYLKDVKIAKKVHIVGLNDENVKQLIYFFGTNKCKNRPTKTLTFDHNHWQSHTIFVSVTLHLNDFYNDYFSYSNDYFKLSARVRRA